MTSLWFISPHSHASKPFEFIDVQVKFLKLRLTIDNELTARVRKIPITMVRQLLSFLLLGASVFQQAVAQSASATPNAGAKSSDKMAEYKQDFIDFDLNKDNRIDAQEIRTQFKGELDPKVTRVFDFEISDAAVRCNRLFNVSYKLSNFKFESYPMWCVAKNRSCTSSFWMWTKIIRGR